MIRRTSAELDLRNQRETGAFFEAMRPEYVFLAAAKVGGDPRERHLHRRVHLRQPDDRLERDRGEPPQRGEEAAEPRLLLHLPEARPPAAEGGVPADRSPRADERALCDCEDRGDQALPLLQRAARHELHLRDADAAEVGEIINIGTGSDCTIRELAESIAKMVGFDGEFSFDATKPNGTPRKLLDVGRINSLGWKARIPLDDGLARTYRWFPEHEA